MHFEINFWYVLANFKGIQDVVVFVSVVFSILIFLGQTVLVYQSFNAFQSGKSQQKKKKLHLTIAVWQTFIKYILHNSFCCL